MIAGKQNSAHIGTEMVITLPTYDIVHIGYSSSVARGRGGGGGGGGGGGYSPPIGMQTKMQNEKNTMFVALLRLFYTLE